MIERTKKRRAKNKTSPATVDAREETELKATDCAVGSAAAEGQGPKRGRKKKAEAILWPPSQGRRVAATPVPPSGRLRVPIGWLVRPIRVVRRVGRNATTLIGPSPV